MISASPTVTDIDGDGDEEILIGTESGILHALRMRNGAEVWRATCGEAIRSSAAVGDVDDDGSIEVLVSGYGAWMFCLDGKTGRRKWRKYLPKHEFYGASKRGVVSSPLIADVDLDGELEVVTGTRSRRVFCLSARSGKMKWFRELKYDPGLESILCVISGSPVVFIGGGEHTSGLGDNALVALRGSDGAELWRAQVHGGIDSSPIVADINGDGRTGSRLLQSCGCVLLRIQRRNGRRALAPQARSNRELHARRQQHRRPGSGRPYFTEHATCRSYTTPLVADMDGDGRLEVVAGSNNGCLVILDGATGAVRCSEQTGAMVRGSPILADLDGDGRLELVIASGARLLLYRTDAVGAECSMFKSRPDHLGWMAPELSAARASSPLPRQKLRSLQLLWCWLIVDAFRYVAFQLDRRFLKPLNLKLGGFHYYY